MKKREIGLLIGLVTVFLLVGCKQEQTKVNSEYASLTWHEKREKKFGIYDYPTLSKKEAVEVLEAKFQLQIPKIIKQTEALFEKDILTEGIVAETPEYSIFVTEEKIQVRGYYPFSREEEIAVFAYIDLTYIYDAEKKVVRLQTQAFSMSNYGEEAVYPKDNFNDLLASTSQLIELPKEELERSIKAFEKNYGEVDQRPVAEKIIFYSNDEEMTEKKGVSQSMRVGFNDKREMREIYAVLVDYTE